MCLYTFWISKHWLYFPNLLDCKVLSSWNPINLLWDIVCETQVLSTGTPVRIFPIIPFHDLGGLVWIQTLCVRCFCLPYSLKRTFFPFGSLRRQILSPHVRDELIIWTCCLMLFGSGRKTSQHTSVFTCVVNSAFFSVSFLKYRTWKKPMCLGETVVISMSTRWQSQCPVKWLMCACGCVCARIRTHVRTPPPTLPVSWYNRTISLCS